MIISHLQTKKKRLKERVVSPSDLEELLIKKERRDMVWWGILVSALDPAPKRSPRWSLSPFIIMRRAQKIPSEFSPERGMRRRSSYGSM